MAAEVEAERAEACRTAAASGVGGCCMVWTVLLFAVSACSSHGLMVAFFGFRVQHLDWSCGLCFVCWSPCGHHGCVVTDAKLHCHHVGLNT